jgi:5,10-methylenetetrahydrofolate reductase
MSLAKSAPKISFEFFPPQSMEASFRLWDTVNTLAPLAPNFVSVTYGAGGTTRDLTHDAVGIIHRNYGLNVAAHLTCVNRCRPVAAKCASGCRERCRPRPRRPRSRRTARRICGESSERH